MLYIILSAQWKVTKKKCYNDLEMIIDIRHQLTDCDINWLIVSILILFLFYLPSFVFLSFFLNYFLFLILSSFFSFPFFFPSSFSYFILVPLFHLSNLLPTSSLIPFSSKIIHILLEVFTNEIWLAWLIWQNLLK